MSDPSLRKVSDNELRRRLGHADVDMKFAAKGKQRIEAAEEVERIRKELAIRAAAAGARTKRAQC